MTSPDDDELLARLRAIAGFDLELPEIRDVLESIPGSVDRCTEVGRKILDIDGELTGVRDATPGRHVTVAFTAGTLTVEIDPVGRLAGQAPDDWAGQRLVVETLAATTTAEVDEFGLFDTAVPGPGPFRLCASIDGRQVSTSWLLR